MPRLLFALLVTAACSKSAGNQDKVSSPPPPPAGGADVIAVPQAGTGPSMGKAAAEPAAAKPSTGDDDRFKLKPEEGKLAIEVPADAKAGAETTARITVTPGSGYHVNLEYPVKLTLTSPTGVTLAKSEFVAGGHDKGKGDADAFDDNQLALSVKLTPTASGSYTINGNFKFAVCDKDQCLAKKEQIAIVVAAK
ncbi:MAG: hypothetical protein H7138_21120 [Myxococcales bacterium]|nr:hypothetical protein [Myxococcales bacterium]